MTAEKTIEQIKENNKDGYNDSKPYWWHNCQSTDQKKELIKELTYYGFSGLLEDENKEAMELYKYAITSPQNKREVAELLVDVHTFNAVNVDPDMTEKEKEEFEELQKRYNGIDAYVESAIEEFYNNLTGDIADYDEIREFFLR